MTSGVKMAPTFHFYKDGAKLKEYVGSSYPALEVRLNLTSLGSPLTPLLRSARWVPSSPATNPPPSLPSLANQTHLFASTRPNAQESQHLLLVSRLLLFVVKPRQA